MKKNSILLVCIILQFCSCSFLYDNFTEPSQRNEDIDGRGHTRPQRDTTNIIHNDTIITETKTDKKENVISPNKKYELLETEYGYIINVYLGWSFDEMETRIILEIPDKGGEIIINCYTNDKSISMYGFSKYAYDYYFVLDDTYCGYYSFSENTKELCKYKLIILPCENKKRGIIYGYWTCNDYPCFYSLFGIIIN